MRRPAIDRAGIGTALAAAGDAIASRSGASIGDKTVLESIACTKRDALAAESGAGSLHDRALRAAEQALEAYRERESRIGRARMYGAKSADSDNPGMLAVVLWFKAAR